jgi:TrpR family trp operon transcriptional repressor
MKRAEDIDLIARNLKEMSETLAAAHDPRLIEEFLYSLYTKSEADEIAKRWALVKDLASGIPQRQIAQNLGLSLCKITRGSRELKKPDSAFRRMLQIAGIRIEDRKKTRGSAKAG